MAIVNLSKVCHNHGQLRIHACVANKVPSFQRVFGYCRSFDIGNLEIRKSNIGDDVKKQQSIYRISLPIDQKSN
jgi:hypothetical protein